jgi:hypothetical protein
VWRHHLAHEPGRCGVRYGRTIMQSRRCLFAAAGSRQARGRPTGWIRSPSLDAPLRHNVQDRVLARELRILELALEIGLCLHSRAADRPGLVDDR